jgi:multiple sugar transport system substrate-binding protein
MLRSRSLLALVATSLALVGAGCGSSPVSVRPVSLDYWRMEDADGSMDAVIAKYRELHPNVAIKVRTFREEDLHKELLEAFAEDRGPDMMSVPNVWLRQWQAQISPLPAELSVATTTRGKDGKTVSSLQKTTTPSVRELVRDYVEAVPKDVVLSIPATKTEPASQQILGIPFSSDTLALFSNAALLKKAGITAPPQTWQELQADIAKLTVRNADGKITQAGVALGVANNVRHSTEILGSIMVQNGATMADAKGQPSFQLIQGGSGGRNSAQDALNFYKRFALENGPDYAWNATLPDSLDAFTSGQLAFYLGYPTDWHRIRERNPRLEMAISALPQVDPSSPASMARYPVETVLKKSAHPNEAWDFIVFASKPANVTSYLDAARRPPALRELLADATLKPGIAPFANQSLIAVSWYRGRDYPATEAAFARLIETPLTREVTTQTVLNQAALEIQKTLR